MSFLSELGTRFRELRVANGWTQAGVAEKAGIGLEHYSKIENGNETRNPTIKLLESVCGVFGMTLAQVAFQTQNGKPVPIETMIDFFKRLGDEERELIYKLIAKLARGRGSRIPRRR